MLDLTCRMTATYIYICVLVLAYLIPWGEQVLMVKGQWWLAHLCLSCQAAFQMA